VRRRAPVDKTTILQHIDRIEQELRNLRAHIEAEQEVVDLGRQGTWHAAKLAHLLPRTDHLPGVLALFDLTAEWAPHTVTYSNVLARSGLTDQQQSREHSRLSWATRRLFGTKGWPLECWQGADEMLYRMPAAIAGWWLALRDGDSQAAAS
jgi:hypothetical protein